MSGSLPAPEPEKTTTAPTPGRLVIAVLDPTVPEQHSPLRRALTGIPALRIEQETPAP